jgi:hypothetical protein
VNRFRFGTFYQQGCPAGVAAIKKAVSDYLGAVLSERGTKIIRSNPCEP